MPSEYLAIPAHADVKSARVWVGQSQLRHDLLPSFWSIAGVMRARDRVLTVPIDEQLAPTDVPSRNAIHECPLSAYDDPRRYPNIAVVNFVRRGEAVARNVRRLSHQRTAIDLPHLLVQWVGFVWGRGRRLESAGAERWHPWRRIDRDRIWHERHRIDTGYRLRWHPHRWSTDRGWPHGSRTARTSFASMLQPSSNLPVVAGRKASKGSCRNAH